MLFYGAFGVDLITGAIIKEDTGGDPTKEAARATEALAITNGFSQLLQGNATAGINAIAAAVQGNKALSPDQTMAIQNLILLAGNQAGLLQDAEQATILGQAAAALITNVLNEVTAVCNKFIAAAPAKAA
jgi:hypothetical protein